MSKGTDVPPVKSAPVPWWRAALGAGVAVVGTVALLLPAWFAFAFAEAYKDGQCRASGIVPDTCDSTAAEGYAQMMVMLVAPTILGLLIARPRHAGKVVIAVLVVALIIYLLLVFVGETVPPPPIDSRPGA